MHGHMSREILMQEVPLLDSDLVGYIMQLQDTHLEPTRAVNSGVVPRPGMVQRVQLRPIQESRLASQLSSQRSATPPRPVVRSVPQADASAAPVAALVSRPVPHAAQLAVAPSLSWK